MRTITKQSLDVLARTMSVIPMSKLMGIIAGGSYTQYFSTQSQLNNFLSAQGANSEWKETAFVIFADGTFAAYFDDDNTRAYCSLPLTPSTAGNYYFEGKQITGWGHTHDDISGPGPSDDDQPNKVPGLSHYIWYGGSFSYY